MSELITNASEKNGVFTIIYSVEGKEGEFELSFKATKSSLFMLQSIESKISSGVFSDEEGSLIAFQALVNVIGGDHKFLSMLDFLQNRNYELGVDTFIETFLSSLEKASKGKESKAKKS